MATKQDLPDWVHDALVKSGGSGTLVEVTKEIWIKHQNELESSKDLFYTWQYDMRWAATRLRKSGVMKSADVSPKGVWELK